MTTSCDDADGATTLFAEINITPLTDVFLVLVIIFMVSALAIQAEQAPKRAASSIVLPRGGAADVDPAHRDLVIELSIAGDTSVGGKRLDGAALDRLLRAAVGRDPQAQVVIAADQGVLHGTVVRLMERARRAGARHLAIGTAPR